MTATTKRKTIRDLYPPHMSDHDAAMNALKILKVTEPALSMLSPLVIRDVQIFRRSATHATEAEVPMPEPASKDASKTSPLLRAELLAETFALGDGRRVRWGEATEEDHAARIEFLTRQIRGTQQTIGRHASAIDLLREHEAKCLDQIAGSDADEPSHDEEAAA